MILKRKPACHQHPRKNKWWSFPNRRHSASRTPISRWRVSIRITSTTIGSMWYQMGNWRHCWRKNCLRETYWHLLATMRNTWILANNEWFLNKSYHYLSFIRLYFYKQMLDIDSILLQSITNGKTNILSWKDTWKKKEKRWHCWI